MIITQVFSFPVFGRRRRRKNPIYQSSNNDDIWEFDADDKKRINENKKWRRHHPAEDAWDIDKERDAVMYKRESLEAALRLEYIEKDDVNDDKTNLENTSM
jgi:hypothetical protein